MENNLSITFQLLVGEDHIAVEDLLQNPESLLDYYLADEDQTDSTFQGGYCIVVNGKKWNGDNDFYFDLFAYSLNWLKGIQELLLKETNTAEVGFWEESVAKATLVGETQLQIEDASVNGRVLAPAEVVDFELFSRELLKAGRGYEALAASIKQLIHVRGPLIEEQEGERIIQEMCGREYQQYNDAVEVLIEKRFG
ncbi:MAG: hypothetical protein JWM14_2766 [Chitinophagaceae bacterium]|nr:hypothetical protein [Chitinophagaceae bacterium]